MALTDPANRAEYNRLRALRARAVRRGMAVDLSRRAITPNQLGGYMIRDLETDTVIDGGRFELTLDEAEARVAEIVSGYEAAVSTGAYAGPDPSCDADRRKLQKRMRRVAGEDCPAFRDKPRRGSIQGAGFLRTTAWHEAGHAVAAAALGIPIEFAAVQTYAQIMGGFDDEQRALFGQEGCFGLVRVREEDVNPAALTIVKPIITAAGPAAEILGGGSANTFYLDSDPDMQGADAAKLFLDCFATIEAKRGTKVGIESADVLEMCETVWSKACHFSCDMRAIRAIEAVAFRLFQNGRLTGDEILEIVERHGVRDVSVLVDLVAEAA